MNAGVNPGLAVLRCRLREASERARQTGKGDAAGVRKRDLVPLWKKSAQHLSRGAAENAVSGGVVRNVRAVYILAVMTMFGVSDCRIVSHGVSSTNRGYRPPEVEVILYCRIPAMNPSAIARLIRASRHAVSHELRFCGLRDDCGDSAPL